MNFFELVHDQDERWHFGESRDRVIIDYFSQLFSSTSHGLDPSFLEHVPLHVDASMQQRLNENFTKEKVLVALKQIHPTKAPDPMAWLLYFFKNMGM